MEEGRDLQIPLYIRAIRELFLNREEDVIGGGYYSISEGTRLNGLYRADRREYTGISSNANSNVDPAHFEEVIDGAERYAWRYVDGMRRGDFRVAPQAKACSWCAYAMVCRFERNRIRRKTND
jgi:ATP-dependent helicase/nuclease subunit B